MDPVLRALLSRVGTVDGTRFSVRRTVGQRIGWWILSIYVEMDIEFWWDVRDGTAGIRVLRVS